MRDLPRYEQRYLVLSALYQGKHRVQDHGTVAADETSGMVYHSFYNLCKEINAPISIIVSKDGANAPFSIKVFKSELKFSMLSKNRK